MTTSAISIFSANTLSSAEPVKLSGKSSQAADTSFSDEFKRATEADSTTAKADSAENSDNAVKDAESKEPTDNPEPVEDSDQPTVPDQEDAAAVDTAVIAESIAVLIPQNMLPIEGTEDVVQPTQPQQSAVSQAAVMPEQAPAGEALAKTAETTVQNDQPAAQVFVRQIMQEVERAMQPKASDTGMQDAAMQLESEGQVVKIVTNTAESSADTDGAGEELAGRQKETQASSSAQMTHTLDTSQTKVFAEHMEEPAVKAENVQTARETFLGKLVDQVRTAISNERQELYIQLKPEHLGGLSIALTMTEKGLTAKLATSSHEVQAMLNSDLAAMQAALRERGIHVVQMDVIYDQSANLASGSFSENNGRWFGGGNGSGQHTSGSNDAAILDVSELFVDYGSLLEPESSLEFNA